MRTRDVTLHDTGGTLLLTLVARDNDPAADTPLRNFDAVQPPGSEVQGVFGDGIFQVGIIERDLAFCNVGSYASIFHAKAALDTALAATASIRVGNFSLPIAAAQGVTEWAHLTFGLVARVRFIPSSSVWTNLSDASTARGLL